MLALVYTTSIMGGVFINSNTAASLLKMGFGVCTVALGIESRESFGIETKAQIFQF